MKKKDQIKYNSWSEHLNNTRERTNYSIRRMDLLIISISGAGIYIVFETFKEIKSGTLIIDDFELLKYSGIIFLIAICSNFLSQLTGYYANSNEEKYSILELSKIDGEKIDKKEQDNIDKWSKIFDKSTDVLNALSMFLMFVGLFLLAKFTYYLF